MVEAVELAIDRLGAQGDGVAETPAGPVFVPFTLPGERVRAVVEGERGRLVDVVQPSPERAEPICPHFGTCGGCALQHMGGAAYRSCKVGQVRAAFAARGLDVPLGELRGVGHGGRRRAAFSARRTAAGAILGFHAAATHTLVDLEVCPVLAPRIVTALGPLRRLVTPLLSRTGEARVMVLDADNGLDVAIDDVARDLQPDVRAGLAALAAAAGLVRLSVNGETVFAQADPIIKFGPAEVVPPPGAFLQASRGAEAAMADLILAALPKRAKRVADLFAGLGAFAFPLATRVAVFAADQHAASLEALASAARRVQGIKPIETRARDLFREPLSRKELEPFDAVVFDPPRAGAIAQAETLAKSKVGTVIAVSCNPATLARDCRVLVDGGYRLELVTPIDQFLYSPHIEAVAVLRR